MTGGEFVQGAATKQVVTQLGNLHLEDDDVTNAAVEKEKKQYFYFERLTNTRKQELLPAMTVTSTKNKDTENGKVVSFLI
jgi:hypothetical protein